MSYNRPLTSGPCYLYGLIDPRTGEVFYVGVSWNPTIRLGNHKNDPASSAYLRCREIIAAGFDVEIEIADVFPSRTSAEGVERELIRVLPGLTNAGIYR